MRIQKIALDAFGEMLLHIYRRYVLAVHVIVSTLKRKRVIPYKRTLTKHPVQPYGPGCIIEFVFVCQHR